MRSNLHVSGHSLHSLIAPLAVGGVSLGLAFDIGHLATGKPIWFEMSFWLLSFGTAAAILGAIPGLVDYLTLRMGREARNLANSHFLLSAAMLSIFAVSVRIKWDAALVHAARIPPNTAIASLTLDLTGVAFLAASVWAAGKMVYEHGVGATEEIGAQGKPSTARGSESLVGTLRGERPADTDISEA